jgi:hypothetical protein
MWSNGNSISSSETSWDEVGAYCAFSVDGDNDGAVMSDPATDLQKFGEMVARLKAMDAVRPEVVAKYKLPHSIKRPTSMMWKNLIRGLAGEFGD